MHLNVCSALKIKFSHKDDLRAILELEMYFFMSEQSFTSKVMNIQDSFTLLQIQMRFSSNLLFISAAVRFLGKVAIASCTIHFFMFLVGFL